MTTLVTREQQLASACRAGDLATVKAFLAPPCMVNLNSKFLYAHNETPLSIVCSSGNAEIAAVLIAHPKIDLNYLDDARMTPLCRACKCGSLEIVRLLSRNYRVDLNLPDEYGRPPLWFLVERGSREGVEILLSCGRPVARMYSFGALDLADFAEKKGFTVIAQMIRERTPRH